MKSEFNPACKMIMGIYSLDFWWFLWSKKCVPFLRRQEEPQPESWSQLSQDSEAEGYKVDPSALWGVDFEDARQSLHFLIGRGVCVCVWLFAFFMI